MAADAFTDGGAALSGGAGVAMADALIRTEDIGKRYRADGIAVRALDGVSLEISHGEFIAVMGPSGSGKSTLLNLLGLLDQPSRGRYLLENRDVSEIGADERAAIRNRKIGFVFQSFTLLPRTTAMNNVELPLIYRGLPSAERQRLAAAALAEVGLSHRAAHPPHQMSGGEQQRVAIARALVGDPLLILADEPTGSLDSRTGGAIIELLQRLHRSRRTVLLVTHDRTVASHAERIVSIHDGRVVDDQRLRPPKVP